MITHIISQRLLEESTAGKNYNIYCNISNVIIHFQITIHAIKNKCISI